jgi:hypothetical protein
MGNVFMEIIKGFGYLLIPGFSALFLLLFGYLNRACLEKAKAEHRRNTRRCRY